jgi:hypothetical protein
MNAPKLPTPDERNVMDWMRVRSISCTVPVISRHQIEKLASIAERHFLHLHSTCSRQVLHRYPMSAWSSKMKTHTQLSNSKLFFVLSADIKQATLNFLSNARFEAENNTIP